MVAYYRGSRSCPTGKNQLKAVIAKKKMAKPLSMNIACGNNINGSNSFSINIYLVTCLLDCLVTFPTSFSSTIEPSSGTFLVIFRMYVAFFSATKPQPQQPHAKCHKLMSIHITKCKLQLFLRQQTIAKSDAALKVGVKAVKPIIGPHSYRKSKNTCKA